SQPPRGGRRHFAERVQFNRKRRCAGRGKSIRPTRSVGFQRLDVFGCLKPRDRSVQAAWAEASSGHGGDVQLDRITVLGRISEASQNQQPLTRQLADLDRKSTRLNSSHAWTSYAV